MVTSEYFNGLLAAEIIDHGDGTGTRTTYDEHGNETSVEQLTGLPIPEPAPPDPLSVIAEIGTALGGITNTSTSTTVRAALLAVRSVIDSAI